MKNKYLMLLGMMFFISNIFAQDTEPCDCDFKIIWRREWDKNTKLLSQYQKPIGTYVSFPILGKTRTRKIKELCYLSPTDDSLACMQEIYWGVAIHHTAFDTNTSAVEQVLFIRNGQILDKGYGFSDIAYHFAISNDGKIFEARPMTHMGTHAGKVKEKYLRCDPDYGLVGIVLVGNFDKREPTKKQIFALKWLLNFLKKNYHISNAGIFYHREIRALVEYAGFTSLAKDKTCPGNKFPSKDSILKVLVPDSQLAKQKQIYICR